MELFTLLIGLGVFAETTALCRKNFSNNTLRSGKIARRRVFVDTSALMDGRILSVARAGFLGDEILIPRSVIRELQLLADGADTEKRTRARYGLDVATNLKNLDSCEARIFADESGNRIKVDERLLELAHENKGIILTNDFNLAKVAATEGIQAININELAQGLRSEYLPGDRMNVRIISAGSNPKQGVAYLPDGTMVVVDEADKYVGKNYPVEIEFVRYLQTNAGKMMFAKIVEEKKVVNEPKADPKNTVRGKARSAASRIKDKRLKPSQKSEAKAAPKTEVKPQSAKPEAKAQPKAPAKPVAKTQSKSETKTAVKAKAKPQHDSRSNKTSQANKTSDGQSNKKKRRHLSKSAKAEADLVKIANQAD